MNIRRWFEHYFWRQWGFRIPRHKLQEAAMAWSAEVLRRDALHSRPKLLSYR